MENDSEEEWQNQNASPISNGWQAEYGQCPPLHRTYVSIISGLSIILAIPSLKMSLNINSKHIVHITITANHTAHMFCSNELKDRKVCVSFSPLNLKRLLSVHRLVYNRCCSWWQTRLLPALSLIHIQRKQQLGSDRTQHAPLMISWHSSLKTIDSKLKSWHFA